MKKKKLTSIGGQAVIEGVMMRGKTAMATAVRDGDGIIRTETKRLAKGKKANRFLRLPVIRGVASFISSLVTGTTVLMRSAEVFGDGEPSKFEKWLSEKMKVDVNSVVSFISVLIALALAVFLFMFVPQLLRRWLESIFSVQFGVWAKNLIEGAIKLLVFVAYILFCSLIKDVRRTFMYHGAEHKTISCYEAGLKLTPENAKKCSRIHDRCGTTFIFFVVAISIICFACFEALVGVPLKKAIGDGALYDFIRILCKIALLPLVSGLSYELLKVLAKTKSVWVLPLKAPGMLLQKITTREPTEDMIEVAIVAFNKAMEMDENPDLEEEKFVVTEKRCVVTQKVLKILRDNSIDEVAEGEWIVSCALGVKRDEVYSNDAVSPKEIDKIYEIVNERITGRPLWYCVGDADFYGFTLKVDERVLIPRPETEVLVSEALKIIDNNKTVLDLCTGSGAIAIAVKKLSGAKVTACDVSGDALTLAEENARLNDAEIEFVEGDLLNAVKGRKFDVILSNPPYIRKQDIAFLQREVKDFEPILALDGGDGGLDFYRRIAGEAKSFLNEKGVVFVECGIGQAKTVAKLFSDFGKVDIIKDYENVERIIKAEL